MSLCTVFVLVTLYVSPGNTVAKGKKSKFKTMTCYLLHSSLYLTRLTEAQLVCADLCWWDEGISHTVQNCAFVFVGRGVALTDGCHRARAHGGNVESVAVSFGKSLWCFWHPVWGSVLTDWLFFVSIIQTRSKMLLFISLLLPCLNLECVRLWSRMILHV